MNIVGHQINFTIGDLEGNYRKIVSALDDGSDVDVHVFSELALTGYPPNDLLLRKGFVDKQLHYLDLLRQKTIEHNYIILIGAVTKNTEPVGKPLRNTAIAYQRGEEIFRYHKQLLPTYNIFDENRYFEAGTADQNQVIDTEICGQRIKFGVLICEDAWNDEAVTDTPLYPSNPAKILGENKDINLIVTLNASPSHIGKNQERYGMYETLARRYGKSILYVNQVGGNDALIFDGFSFYIQADVDNTTGFVELTRYDAPGFVEDYLPVDTDAPFPCRRHLETIKSDPDQIFKHLTLGLKDYVTKNGFKTVVVGSSGGIDSALVLAIAAEAVGAKNVRAITMPSKVSSTGSVDDSLALCNNLEIHLFIRPIVEEVELSIQNFEKAFGEKPSRLTIENEQARIRGRILMEYSNHFGSLVLSTGNKSEISVGYFTLYGDSNGGLAVIGDTYKTQVFDVARWYNSHKRKEIIPNAIIDKAPSAELSPNQVDTDSLPAYPELDAILHLYIEAELLSDNERAYYLSLCEPLTLKEIKRILRLIDATEYKRKQLPPTLRISRRAFGFGRNLPITQKDNVDYRSIL